MEPSATSAAGTILRAARQHAILYVLAASAAFTVGSALVKALAADIPVLEIVMFRSIVGFMADSLPDGELRAGFQTGSEVADLLPGGGTRF